MIDLDNNKKTGLGLAKKVTSEQSKKTADDIISEMDLKNIIREGIIEFGKLGYHSAKNAVSLLSKELNKKVHGFDFPNIDIFKDIACYNCPSSTPYCEFEYSESLSSASEFNKFAYSSPRKRESKNFKYIKGFIDAITCLIYEAVVKYDHKTRDYIIDNGLPSRVNESNLGLAKKARQKAEEKDPIDNISSLIDLGLPSGNLWSTCNVGASEPEEAGKFYTITEAYADRNKFNRFSLPSKKDFEELIQYCKPIFYEDKVEFVSNINQNSIVFPLSGCIDCNGIYHEHSSRFSSGYWSGTYRIAGIYSMLDLDNCDEKVSICEGPDCLRYPLRLVEHGKNVNESSLGLARKTRQQAQDRDAIGNVSHFVDLGLPSGNKWSPCNVNASTQEEYGDFFTLDEVLESKYHKEKMVPSEKDYKELEEHCVINFVEDGVIVTSKINSNSIFFQNCGFYTCNGEYKKWSAVGETSYWTNDLYEHSHNGTSICFNRKSGTYAYICYCMCPSCLKYPLRLVEHGKNVNESSLGLAKKAAEKFNKEDRVERLNSFDTAEDACKAFQEYLDDLGYTKKDKINTDSTSKYHYLPLLDKVVLVSTFSESNWWQLSFFEENGIVRFNIMYSFGDPTLVIGDYENPVKKWWTATQDKLMKVAKFCAESIEMKEGLAKRIANDVKKKNNEEKPDEAASTILRDENEQMEATNSNEFGCMLVQEARKRDLLIHDNNLDLNNPDVPTTIGSEENDNYMFSSGLASYDKGDYFNTYKVLDKIAIIGKVYSYWPVKSFKVISVYTGCDHWGVSKYFVIRIWFDTEDNNRIVKIGFGKVPQIIVMKEDTVVYQFGELEPLPIKKICKIAEVGPEGNLLLTRTNAALIIELMRSFFTHKNDKIQTLEKVSDWDYSGDQMRRVYSYKPKESVLFEKICSLNTKKSNKKICKLIMKFCWQRDFSGKTLHESRTVLGLAKKTRDNFDFDKSIDEVSKIGSFDDFKNLLASLLERHGIEKAPFKRGLSFPYDLKYNDEIDGPWYSPDSKIFRVFFSCRTGRVPQDGNYIDVCQLIDTNGDLIGVMLMFGVFALYADGNYTYSTIDVDVFDLIKGSPLANQAFKTLGGSKTDNERDFKASHVVVNMIASLVSCMKSRMKDLKTQEENNASVPRYLIWNCFVKNCFNEIKNLYKNGEQ